MTARDRDSPENLDVREADILGAVIRAHIETGEAVSSGTVSRAGSSELSPASIRATMSALERSGYLAQPHTSAGRVPTDLAYRYYVDHLMATPRMAVSRARAIDAALEGSSREIEDLLAAASRVLSRFSAQVGVVVAPDVRELVLDRVEFTRVGEHRIVAILVGRSGLVHHRVFDVAESYGQGELDRCGRYLAEHFAGMTLPGIRDAILERIRRDRAAYDELALRSLELGTRAVVVDDEETDVFVDGASNLLEYPEFADVDRIRAMMRALEEKQRLVGLLGQVLDTDGVRVMIGDETDQGGLGRCSLVASRYQAGSSTAGSVGIVGPKRMQYVTAIALVEHLSRVLTRLLTDSTTEKPGP